MIVQCNESHGRKGCRVLSYAAGIYAKPRQRLEEQTAKGVVSPLAEKSRRFIQTGKGCQHVSGSAAGLGGQGRVTGFVNTPLGKIDQQLADGDNVISLQSVTPLQIQRRVIAPKDCVPDQPRSDTVPD